MSTTRRPIFSVATALAVACASPAPPTPSSTPPLPAAPTPSASTVMPVMSVAPSSSAPTAEELRKAREHREQRRREHGPWLSSDIAKWRSAVDGYVSLMQPGNQLPLNAARTPFATYLVAMHNRIHPLFAEWYLESLDDLPRTPPYPDNYPVTGVEIVLSADGHIKQMGVVKPSGVTVFDIAVLDSIDRAQPFGQAPSPILSADGNVYIHWDFHREEVFACSTINARPFLRQNP
jgi:TonB family protein